MHYTSVDHILGLKSALSKRGFTCLPHSIPDPVQIDILVLYMPKCATSFDIETEISAECSTWCVLEKSKVTASKRSRADYSILLVEALP